MKYLEIDAEIDKSMALLCDVFLKAQGMQGLQLVNKIIASVEDTE